MTNTSKPTVLHILPTLATGGAERALAKLVRTSDDVHHEVCVLFPIPTGDHIVFDEMTQAKIPIHCLGITQPIRQWTQALRDIRKLLRTRKITVVITYLTLADMLGRFAVRKTDIPVICWLRSTLREWKYLPLTLANGCTARMVDAFFTVSPVCVAVYKRFFGVKNHQVYTIPNGVDASFFSHHPNRRTATRTHFNIPSDAFVFSYTAVMRPRKGHETLLHAFHEVAKTHPHAHLWLIGDGPLCPSLEERIRSLNLTQVHILGRQADVPTLLDASDAFVFPSEYEGMSNALIEALAMGLPTVSTNIPENVEVTKNAALLVPPTRPDDMAQAMRTLLDDRTLYNEYAKRATQRGAAFALQRTTSLFETAIKDVLARRPCS